MGSLGHIKAIHSPTWENFCSFYMPWRCCVFWATSMPILSFDTLGRNESGILLQKKKKGWRDCLSKMLMQKLSVIYSKATFVISYGIEISYLKGVVGIVLWEAMTESHSCVCAFLFQTGTFALIQQHSALAASSSSV